MKLSVFLLLVVSIINISINYIKTPMNNSELSLKYLVRESALKTEKAPVLILLHGVGSNEKDLFSFADFIDEKYLVVSAQGPYNLGVNRYGWYEVNFSNGKPQINADQAEKSRLALINFIDEIVEKYNADSQKVYLMGFSQGAIMSYSVALSQPEKVAGFAAFSGRVLDTTKQNASKSDQLSKLKVYLAHSRNDQVLSFQYAEEAHKMLESLNIETTYRVFDDGHSISRENLYAFLGWLSKQ
ncbi:MAG: esterase [Thalassobius sp.]|nr:esterase [Thalassovita sp.]